MMETAERTKTAPSVRGFWWIFVGGWVALCGVFASAILLERDASWIPVGYAAAVLVPLALLSVPVALFRRHLLRPERALAKTVLLHVGVALAYGVLSAALTMGALALLGPLAQSPAEMEGRGVPALGWVMNALFLYVILAGFLMWTESMSRVQESRALAAREGMLRAQAEAEAIKAQFNPHFVFNTLHSLMLLVHAEPDVAERAIEDVASLIRYASILQRRSVDLVPLGQEVEVARRYMALEKLRLGDRVTVQWGSLGDLETRGVPPFALQILLENAVKHGIAPRTEGGTIRISGASDGDLLTLTVEDDGQGADPAAVNGADRRGLGLLRQRLETVFGDMATLAWTTAPGEGFRATLSVPRTTPPRVDVPAWDGGTVRAPATTP